MRIRKDLPPVAATPPSEELPSDSPLLVVLAHSLFGGALLLFGDGLDLLAYAVCCALIHIRGRRLFGQGALARLVVWCALHLVFLNALSRVNGYPVRELLPLVFPLASALLLLAAVYAARRGHWRAGALGALLLLLPVVEAPTFLLRQGVGALLAPAAQPGGYRVSYYAKLRPQELFAVGYRDTEGGSTPYVLVFRAERGGYSLREEHALLDGSRTAVIQSPNLPWLMERWSAPPACLASVLRG